MTKLQDTGVSITYCVVGGLVLYAGIRGATMADAAKSVLTGKLSLTNTQAIDIKNDSTTTADTSTAADGTNATPTDASEKAWITALLKDMGSPPTDANISSFTNWIRHEDGGWTQPSGGAANKGGNWNPFNTTQTAPGSTVYNTAGPVQNYKTEQQGLQATVKTLNNGFYPHIIMALKAGKGLATGDSNVQAELMKWSGNGYDSV